MRFTHEGRTYVIEFQREYRMKDALVLQEDGTEKIESVPATRYPDTTAYVLEVKPSTADATGDTGKEERVPYRSYRVGCWHRDGFTLERGRLNALRGITRSNSLSYNFKQALWNAYIKRNDGVVIEGEKVTVH